MKFRIKYAQQVVGVFVLIAAVALIAVIVSMGANQRWFAKNYEYYSVFPSAEGISNGMSIRYKGFEIGRITEIGLTDDDNVRVDFFIQDTFHEKVVENSILQLQTSPIGLGGGMVFRQGREITDPLPGGSLIPSLSSPEGQAIAEADAVIMPASGDSITRIIGQVEPVLRNVNTLLVSVDDTLGHVNSALSGNQDEPLGLTLAQVNTLLSEVETTLVETREQSNQLLASVNVITGNLEGTTAALEDPTGLVPMLLGAEGSIATFLNDNDRLFNQVEQMLISINASLDEVNEFSGFINGTQPQIAGMLEESRAAINTGQDVLEGLSNNPLIRGGITQEVSQPTTFQSYRDDQF
jgi:phospholipid/cholesterol/gamma-HCH transport system substrate-binding protein